MGNEQSSMGNEQSEDKLYDIVDNDPQRFIDKWVDKGYLNAPDESEKKENTAAVLDVRETAAPPKFTLPIEFNDPYHKPHLENFFNTIRGKDTLNCPVEVGYETAVAVLKVNEAIKAKREVKFSPNEFII